MMGVRLVGDAFLFRDLYYEDSRSPSPPPFFCESSDFFTVCRPKRLEILISFFFFFFFFFFGIFFFFFFFFFRVQMWFLQPSGRLANFLCPFLHCRCFFLRGSFCSFMVPLLKPNTLECPPPPPPFLGYHFPKRTYKICIFFDSSLFCFLSKALKKGLLL